MILNRQREVRLERRALESFLRRVKRELGLAKADLTVCLVSDKEMARLNGIFRRKKGSTDVLSFPAVARPKAVRLSRRVKRAESVEYLHGILHLLGYDHETDRGEMDRLEQKLRKRLGIL